MVSSNDTETKTQRGRKRKVVGTDNPPREAFLLRLDKHLVDELNDALQYTSVSRNEFLCRIIANELTHMALFRSLNASDDRWTTAIKKREKRTQKED